MFFDHILANISKIVDLDNVEKKEFCSLLKVHKIKKWDYLIKPNELNKSEYYVNSGCLRSFYVDKEEKEISFYFAIEDWWISDIYARSFDMPSGCGIMALEPSELLSIDFKDFENYLHNFPKMEHFYRKLLQNSLATYQRNVMQRNQSSGLDRYILFRKNYKEFDNRIPQKYIASYLGMTPEFFNRVRTEVLRNL